MLQLSKAKNFEPIDFFLTHEESQNKDSEAVKEIIVQQVSEGININIEFLDCNFYYYY